jgi:uncharacterized lipoprotein YddW (UPF0748 family)
MLRLSSLRSAALLLVLAFLCFGHALSQSPPKREFRGAWIATVANIDWPTMGAPMQTQKDQLVSLLNSMQTLGINSVFFQIRPECDALYASTLEPWSRWLTGTQGMAPGYDPLQFALEEAHKRGMELHAWFNPYRAKYSGGTYTRDASHISNTHPEWIFTIGGTTILDPGKAAVRQYVLTVIADVVRRYDIDGVVMDDYFYLEGTTTQDAGTFSSESRGFTNLGDWRRENVNLLLQGIRDSIQAIRPWVKFGMSPAGIWKNGVPPGTSGNDNYSVLYCDAVTWMQRKYIDYFSPQLYWHFTGPQDYALLEPWWASQLNGRIFCPSLAVYRIDVGTFGSAGEIARQIRFNRANNAHGSVAYSSTQLLSKSGIADTLRLDLFRYPAFMPRYPWKDSIAPYPPRAIKYAPVIAGGPSMIRWDVPITAPDGDSASRYAIYRFDHRPTIAELADTKNLLAVTSERSYNPPKPSSGGGPVVYVVTALDHNYNESDTSNVLFITAPGAPVLASPANGTTAFPESVSVRWRSAATAYSYRLQVATDSTFGTGIILDDSTLTDTSKVIKNLAGQQMYAWRVRATNAGGNGPFSAAYVFSTGTPTAVLPLFPINVSLDVSENVTFRWSSSAQATKYHMQLSTTGDFSAIVIDSSGLSDTSLVSPRLKNYQIYFWRVQAANPVGLALWSTVFRFRTVQATEVTRSNELPKEFGLRQNYPNPFNPTSDIRYQVSEFGHVKLVVYDFLGREVAVLVDQEMAAGVYTVRFDASRLASGTYLYRMTAGRFVDTKRMLLVR